MQNNTAGLVSGYEHAEDTNGNANYLYDDGSVEVYCQISKDEIARIPIRIFFRQIATGSCRSNVSLN